MRGAAPTCGCSRSAAARGRRSPTSRASARGWRSRPRRTGWPTPPASAAPSGRTGSSPTRAAPPRGPPAAALPRGAAPDGKTLYYTADQGGEWSSLYGMDLGTRVAKPVAQPSWDVEVASFSHAGKYFCVATNTDGQFQLELRDAKSDKPVALPPAPPGGAWVPLGTSRTDRYFAVR